MVSLALQTEKSNLQAHPFPNNVADVCVTEHPDDKRAGLHDYRCSKGGQVRVEVAQILELSPVNTSSNTTGRQTGKELVSTSFSMLHLN